MDPQTTDKDSPICIAIDLGAESGRVVAGIFDGDKLVLEELHRFPNRPVELFGRCHWNFFALYRDILDGIAIAAKRHGDRIASLGIDTWGVDFGLIDANGELLGQPYQYRDPRTRGMMEEAVARMPAERLYACTGIQPMFFNTLYQLLGAQKERNVPLANATRLLFTPDLIAYYLTGIQANERTIASTSQLYDPVALTWSADVLAAMGLPHRIFGDIVDPGTVLGPVREPVAKACGFAHQPKVVAVGAHDTASAVAGIPADSTDWAFLSSGTWSIMGLESPRPHLDERTRTLGFANEGGVEGTTRVLRNICGLWLLQECRRAWAAEGNDLDYDAITRMAAAAPALVSIVDPDWAPFADAGDMPAKIVRYCSLTNQPVPATPGAMARCIVDSLALKYAQVFRQLEALAGHRLGTLNVVGGGTRNALLNQATANALARRVVTGPVEATSAGNILLQLKALGRIPSLAAGRAAIARSFDIAEWQPDSATAREWAEANNRFEILVARPPRP